jgi:hypothetical protein
MTNIDYVLVEDVTNNILERVVGAKEFRTGSPPILNGKPFKWLPYVEDVEPVYDEVTHKRLVSVEVITDTEVTLTHPIKKKTAGELQADILGRIAFLDMGLIRIVEDIMVAIATGASLTRANFPAAIWDKINDRRKLRGLDDI